MYNSKLMVKVESVAPYSIEKKGSKKEGLTVTVSCTVSSAKIFDDVDFGKNRNGLKTILDGTLPIKGTGVRLAYIKKKDTTITADGVNAPVSVDDMFTGPMKNNTATVRLKLDVKKLDEEIAGMFAAALGEELEITIKSSQMDAPFKDDKSAPAAAAGKPVKDEKKRTTGKLALHNTKA